MSKFCADIGQGKKNRFLHIGTVNSSVAFENKSRVVFFSYTVFSNGKFARVTVHYVQIYNYEQNFVKQVDLKKKKKYYF